MVNPVRQISNRIPYILCIVVMVALVVGVGIPACAGTNVTPFVTVAYKPAPTLHIPTVPANSLTAFASAPLVSASLFPTGISYQGKLMDASGNPLTGTYTVTFSLYNASTGGTALSTDSHAVQVSQGLFTTTLNFNTNDINGQALWLGIAVNTDPEMTPRQSFQPVPYALMAQGVNAVTSGTGGNPVSLTTTGSNSYGVWSTSGGDNSIPVFAYSYGSSSTGIEIITFGSASPGAVALTTNTSSPGFSAATSGLSSPGIEILTAGSASPGATVSTANNSSPGFSAQTAGSGSDGVMVQTSGNNSEGLFAFATGPGSRGVLAQSDKAEGVLGNSAEAAGVYGASTQAAGVYGTSTQSYGIEGVTDNATSYGVYTPNRMDARLGFVTNPVDVAEYMPASGDTSPGTVMVIGPAGNLTPSTTAYDTKVAGIISTNPGLTLGKNEDDNSGDGLIAVAGRVPCKVDAHYGAIHAGDLLTTSPTEGYAMKAQPVTIGGIQIYRPGTVLGKAMGSVESGTGTIDVIVTLQ
jgi:hypothetical protein